MSQAPEDTLSESRLQGAARWALVVVGVALVTASTLDTGWLERRLILRMALTVAGAVPLVVFIVHQMPQGRISDRNRRVVLLAILAVHAMATCYFMPLSVIVDGRPVVTVDHPVHYYQAERTREVFWHTFQVERYDPYFMAGYPGGTLFDLDMKAAELFCAISPLSAARSLKLFILCAYLTILSSLYWGSRMQGFGLEETVLGTICFLAFWHWGRPYGGEFRFAGMFSFVFASHLSFLLVGLFRQFVFGAWRKTFFVLGPFAFLAHATMVVIVAVPFVVIMLVLRKYWFYRRTVGLVLWALGVIFINIIWLHPLITHIGEKSPTDVYYQVSGLRDLASIIVRPGCGIALGMVGLALIGTRTIQREQRLAAALPAVSTICFLFVIGTFGVWLPGIRQLEPGRFLFAAFVFLAPLAGAGARWVLWRGSELLSARAGARVRAIAMALAIAAMLPLSALESKAYYRHTIATSLSPAVDELIAAVTENVDGPGRLLFEDAPARVYGGGHVGAILPILTGVEQIGGPYPHTFLVHSFTSFANDQLLGRHLTEWTPSALAEALSWLDVRWILTSSQLATETFSAVSWVERVWVSHRYTLWRTTYARIAPAIEATINSIVVDMDEVEERVIPYHWMDGLQTDPPARIGPIERPPDPVPFIWVESRGAKRVIITY